MRMMWIRAICQTVAMRFSEIRFLLFTTTFSYFTTLQAQSQISFLELTNTSSHKKSNYSLSASVIGLNYFSDSSVDSNFQQQVEMGGQLKAQFSNFTVAGEGLLGTYSEPNSHYQAVPELYISYGDLNGNNLFIGRKKILFSAVDENEHLGLYQSFFSNDFINFKSQGLIGIGGQLSNGYVGLTGGAFSHYIPNQAPQVFIENGKVSSSNRWARRPPPQFSFMDKNREIIYAIRDYSVWDIMNSPGIAFSTFFNPSEMVVIDRPLLKVSYAHLPINDIPLARETYGNIQLVGQVLLSPVVTYHNVQSVDLNIDANNLLQTTLSYIQDQPNNGNPADGETLQHLEPIEVIGIQLKSDLSQILNRRMIASIQYSEIRGGDIKDLQSNGQPGTFNFASRRSRFKKPLTLAASTDFIVANKPLKSEVKWTYDMVEHGSLLSATLGIQAWKQLAMNLGFDLLGVESENPQNQSFLQLNQSNDRVYGGLNYVF